MGNGASVKFDKSVIQVNVKHGSSIKYNLAAVEKLCRNGYFQQNFSSLLQAVKLSIEKDALDVLEVLLTLDDVRKTKPLHFASLVGKLESVELLVSAGYACNISDEDGRTPLHLSCSNPSAESGLCTTFLSIRFKNAITAIDNHGNTPLHSAVSNRNIHSVKALLDTVYDPSLILKNKDRSGRTAKDLASNLDYTDIWKLLSDREKNSNQNISSRSSAYSIPTKDQSKNVDQERIMQIWEKFFENAFKRFLIEDDDENDNNGHLVAGASSAGNSRNNLVRNSNRESMNASRIADDKRHSRSTGKKNDKKEKPYHSHEASSYWDEDENEDLLYSDYKKKTSKHNPSDRSVRVNSTQKSLPHGSPSSRRPPHTPAFDYHTSLLSWFDWVVAYDGNYPDGTGYYVIHRHTKETRWLQDHLQLSRPQLLHWQGYVGQVDSSTQMLPRSLMEAVAGTWLPYYDRPTDQCCWISLSSADLQQVRLAHRGSVDVIPFVVTMSYYSISRKYNFIGILYVCINLCMYMNNSVRILAVAVRSGLHTI